MKFFQITIISLLIFSFFDRRLCAQTQEELPSVKINLEIVVKGVFKFFDLFSDSRGCVQGKILNYTLRKLLDPNLKVNSLCLNRISGYDKFVITWKLTGEDNFYSRKLGISFKNDGVISAALKDRILFLRINGLHYHIQRKPQKVLHAIVKFPVKEVQLIESMQHIKVRTSTLLVPVIIEGGISYYLKNFYLERIRVLGIKFKIKRKN